MFETLKNALMTKDIRNKIFLTLLMILVYRIGCYIPVPGLNSSVLDVPNFLWPMLDLGICRDAVTEGREPVLEEYHPSHEALRDTVASVCIWSMSFNMLLFKCFSTSLMI